MRTRHWIYHGGTEDTKKKGIDIEQQEAEIAEKEISTNLCFLCFLLFKSYCLTLLRALRVSVVISALN